MPQPFSGAVMTNNGAALLTRAQAGEIKIEFTRMVVGNGTYSASEKTLAKLQQATKLKSQKNSYTLSDIDVYSNYSVKVTGLITNQDPVSHETLVTEGYYINEIGLYAKPSGGASDTEAVFHCNNFRAKRRLHAALQRIQSGTDYAGLLCYRKQ